MKLPVKLLAATTAVVCTVMILLGLQSYLNKKEVKSASSQCEEKGGQPVVEQTFLTLSYSFSCESE